MKKILFIFMFLLLLISDISAGSPGTYREHIYRMNNKIDTFLIDNDYCIDKSNCVFKEYYFSKPLLDGARLSFYTIRKEKDIDAIINIAKEEYLDNDKKIFIELNFYKKSHRNTVEKSLSISGDKPIKIEKFIHRDSFLFFLYELIGANDD